MKSKAIDWRKIWQKNKGRWVALKNDERTVVAVGKTAKEAWEKAIKKGYKKPILAKMPPKIIPFVGKNEILLQKTWS